MSTQQPLRYRQAAEDALGPIGLVHRLPPRDSQGGDRDGAEVVSAGDLDDLIVVPE